jgi:hypothetical protein
LSGGFVFAVIVATEYALRLFQRNRPKAVSRASLNCPVLFGSDGACFNSRQPTLSGLRAFSQADEKVQHNRVPMKRRNSFNSEAVRAAIAFRLRRFHPVMD